MASHPRPSAHKNQSLTITSINEYGYGVGQKAGQTITVARTAPGDQVLIGPARSPDRWTSADLKKVVQPGPDRVEPPCHGFVEGCGGCQWLHLNYPAQIAWKQKNLTALLRTRAAFRGVIHPLIPLADPQGYRNKLSLKAVGGRLVFVPEVDESPVAPPDCFVQTPALQRAWAGLRPQKIVPGIEQLHLRSNAGGQVGIHAFLKEGARVDAALEELLATCPGAVGLGATTRQGYRIVAGDGVLAQTLGTTTWLIPHNGFFQTNQTQAATLVDVVRQAARVTRQDRVLDLYCGAGFFGLTLAAAREVIGIEENPQSVEAARASAQRSGITNARFVAGDLGPSLAALTPAPDEVAVVDPPREGLLPRALEAVIARRPRRIVYVSCYPQSLARDLKALAAAGWKGAECTPLDMFPHTSHVELVVTLER